MTPLRRRKRGADDGYAYVCTREDLYDPKNWEPRETKMADTFWVVEMQGVDTGEINDRRVFDDPAKLGDYVRVNARDARLFRIAIADEANLVELRIDEAFTGV